MDSMRPVRSALVAVAAFSLFASAAFAADGTFDRTLKVNGPVLLGIDTGSGNIHIVTGPDNMVHIIGHVHSGNSWLGGGSGEQKVQSIVNHPPINQAGNIISVGHNFNVNNISIDYEIMTPRGTDLRADSGSGNIQADNIGGPVELKTGSGNITGSGLSDHVSLESGDGNITASVSSALDVKAQTGSGDIKLQGVQSGLWAETGSGNLTVAGRPLANWKLQSGSGDVNLNIGSAPILLNASTGSGDISYTGGNLRQQNTASKQHLMGDANGGGPLVRITTGSGNVKVD
jgi:hypothetical protein